MTGLAARLVGGAAGVVLAFSAGYVMGGKSNEEKSLRKEIKSLEAARADDANALIELGAENAALAAQQKRLEEKDNERFSTLSDQLARIAVPSRACRADRGDVERMRERLNAIRAGRRGVEGRAGTVPRVKPGAPQ